MSSVVVVGHNGARRSEKVKSLIFFGACGIVANIKVEMNADIQLFSAELNVNYTFNSSGIFDKRKFVVRNGISVDPKHYLKS